MMSPTAPKVNKDLIWHLYSAQAYGVKFDPMPVFESNTDRHSRSFTVIWTSISVVGMAAHESHL